jgi:hypothetical protein
MGMRKFLSTYGLIELGARTFQNDISSSPESVGETEPAPSFVVIDVDDDDVDMRDTGTANRPIKADLQ